MLKKLSPFQKRRVEKEQISPPYNPRHPVHLDNHLTPNEARELMVNGENPPLPNRRESEDDRPSPRPTSKPFKERPVDVEPEHRVSEYDKPSNQMRFRPSQDGGYLAPVHPSTKSTVAPSPRRTKTQSDAPPRPPPPGAKAAVKEDSMTSPTMQAPVYEPAPTAPAISVKKKPPARPPVASISPIALDAPIPNSRKPPQLMPRQRAANANLSLETPIFVSEFDVVDDADYYNCPEATHSDYVNVKNMKKEPPEPFAFPGSKTIAAPTPPPKEKKWVAEENVEVRLRATVEHPQPDKKSVIEVAPIKPMGRINPPSTIDTIDRPGMLQMALNLDEAVPLNIPLKSFTAFEKNVQMYDGKYDEVVTAPVEIQKPPNYRASVSSLPKQEHERNFVEMTPPKLPPKSKSTSNLTTVGVDPVSPPKLPVKARESNAGNSRSSAPERPPKSISVMREQSFNKDRPAGRFQKRVDQQVARLRSAASMDSLAHPDEFYDDVIDTLVKEDEESGDVNQAQPDPVPPPRSKRHTVQQVAMIDEMKARLYRKSISSDLAEENISTKKEDDSEPVLYVPPTLASPRACPVHSVKEVHRNEGIRKDSDVQKVKVEKMSKELPRLPSPSEPTVKVTEQRTLHSPGQNLISANPRISRPPAKQAAPPPPSTEDSIDAVSPTQTISRPPTRPPVPPPKYDDDSMTELTISKKSVLPATIDKSQPTERKAAEIVKLRPESRNSNEEDRSTQQIAEEVLDDLSQHLDEEREIEYIPPKIEEKNNRRSVMISENGYPVLTEEGKLTQMFDGFNPEKRKSQIRVKADAEETKPISQEVAITTPIYEDIPIEKLIFPDNAQDDCILSVVEKKSEKTSSKRTADYDSDYVFSSKESVASSTEDNDVSVYSPPDQKTQPVIKTPTAVREPTSPAAKIAQSTVRLVRPDEKKVDLKKKIVQEEKLNVKKSSTTLTIAAESDISGSTCRGSTISISGINGSNNHPSLADSNRKEVEVGNTVETVKEVTLAPPRPPRPQPQPRRPPVPKPRVTKMMVECTSEEIESIQLKPEKPSPQQVQAPTHPEERKRRTNDLPLQLDPTALKVDPPNSKLRAACQSDEEDIKMYRF